MRTAVGLSNQHYYHCVLKIFFDIREQYLLLIIIIITIIIFIIIVIDLSLGVLFNIIIIIIIAITDLTPLKNSAIVPKL